MQFILFQKYKLHFGTKTTKKQTQKNLVTVMEAILKYIENETQ